MPLNISLSQLFYNGQLKNVYYSFLAALPEPKGGDYTHWVFPLSAQRIASTQKATDQEGRAVYKNPLHVVVFGKRQNELTLLDIYDSFKERFNLEHFFRFGKQRLLLASAQTPIVETEENWCAMVVLTYQQLFLARQEAQQVRRPWETKTEVDKKETRAATSPSATQRDFTRIIRGIGTPAQSPKPAINPMVEHKASNPHRESGLKSSKRRKNGSFSRPIHS